MLAKLFNWLDDRAVEKHRAATLRQIDEHGWTGTYVYGEGGKGDTEFAYTVGFSDFGAPELIIFSLDPMLINGIFWEYFNAMRAGTRLEDGLIFRPDDPEMEGFECTLRSAVKSATWEKFVFDSIHYSLSKGRTNRPPVMQVVWPSESGCRYPWSPNCPAEVIASQPALFEGAPPFNARVIGLSS